MTVRNLDYHEFLGTLVDNTHTFFGSRWPSHNVDRVTDARDLHRQVVSTIPGATRILNSQPFHLTTRESRSLMRGKVVDLPPGGPIGG